MWFEKLVTYFLPQYIRSDKTHPRYDEFRVILSSILIGLPLMLFFPAILYFINKDITGYLINDALVICIVLSIKFFGHYRIPMTITAIVTYFIIYDWIAVTGMIYSPNVAILHVYLLAAIWADKRYGWYALFSNLIVLGYIYYRTTHIAIPLVVHQTLSGPEYALAMHALITLFFGGFLGYQQLDQERDRAKIRALQDKKIGELDEAVKQRTEELLNMRENIATDFHDETGNMLSAITRQASLLKLKLTANPDTAPILENIIANSNALYDSSKDFLWHLNHNSDDPEALFDYITHQGQHYYNQFDIAFSSSAGPCDKIKLAPSAALNVIYIFKEAMTNVVKHSGAEEVHFQMECTPEGITYTLSDNGTWKDKDEKTSHYGLSNMQRRSNKNHFDFRMVNSEKGTTISIIVPIINID